MYFHIIHNLVFLQPLLMWCQNENLVSALNQTGGQDMKEMARVVSLEADVIVGQNQNRKIGFALR